MRIYNNIAKDGFRDDPWDPASGQYERLQALGNKTSWKDGYFMVENGRVLYPYIDRKGRAQISGIRAVISRSAQQKETKVYETASRVLEMINKALEEE